MITRLIVGGAQQNTIQTVEGLMRDGYRASVIVGPQTGPEGELFTEATERGVPIDVLKPLVRQVSLINDVRAALALFRTIRRYRPSVVHTHSSKAGILGRIAAWMVGVPVVVHTIHGWGFNSRQPLRRRLPYVLAERLCARMSDCLVAVSTDNVDEGLANGIGRPDQYVVVRSGIDVERYEKPRRHLVSADVGVPSGAPIVGTVARLSAQKSPADFVRMAKAVKKEIPAAHFVYVGDGRLRAAVEEQIAAEGLADCVHLLGLRDDVPDLLPLFDVFVSTSLWEGLPRTFLQAMAASKPIVSTRVPGALEVIRPGVTGYVADLGDVDGLSAGVVRILRDPELGQRMGRVGRELLADEFTAESMVRQLEALYDRLLSDQGSLS